LVVSSTRRFTDDLYGPPTVGVNDKYWNNDSLKKIGLEAGKGEFTATPGVSAFDTSPVFQTQDGKPLAQKQEDKPKEDKSSYTFATRKGEANSVADRLDTISFVPGSYGAMSASIAYIRYWSRKPAAQKTPVSSETLQGGPADPKDQTKKGLGEVAVGMPNLSNAGTAFSQQNALASTSNIPTPSVALETNPSTLRNESYQYSAPAPEPPADTPKKSPTFFDRVGSLFSANPSGSASLPDAPSPTGPTKYASNDAPNPESAVWQFLFNPEELQLSSGPDYNRAETWGVSDAANHGQPVSWRAHKNRKLTFSKVLLHGYAFGRRVDKLEIGLQDLFMARSGEGMDSPPVLEFVWGSRTFGPCVIQNIQVREKAWDKGLLVNAEVSFELEQIPEWTVNDGFVDVLRPGRQPVLNDQSLEAKGYDDQNGGEPEKEEPAKEKGAGSGKPVGTRVQQLQAVEKKCKKARLVNDKFSSLSLEIRRSGSYKFIDPYTYKANEDVIQPDGFTFELNNMKRKIQANKLKGYIESYSRIHTEFLNSVEGASKLPSQFTPEKIWFKFNQYYKELGFTPVPDGFDNALDKFTKKTISDLLNAIEKCSILSKNYFNSSKCTDVSQKLQKAQKEKSNENENKYKCNNIKENKPCSNPGKSETPKCGNKTTEYVCQYPEKGSAQYRSNPKSPIYKKVK
jgi:hypothetical protein